MDKSKWKQKYKIYISLFFCFLTPLIIFTTLVLPIFTDKYTFLHQETLLEDNTDNNILGDNWNWIKNETHVYVNNSKAYISASPHTLQADGWVEFDVESKIKDIDADAAIGFNKTEAVPTKMEIWRNYTHYDWKQKPENNIHINNTITNIDSYCNLGIENYNNYVNIIGNKNNTKLYMVNYTTYDLGVIEKHTIILAFLDAIIINSTSATFHYLIDGFKWVKTGENYWDWQPFTKKYQIKNINLYNCSKWVLFENLSLIEDKRYKVRVWFDLPFGGLNGTKGKYWFAIKPHDKTLQQAIDDNQFLYLDPWWDASWGYYKVLNIVNKRQHYQMNVTVYKNDGHDDAPTGVIDTEGHCNDDFSDIVFMHTDNVTELPYWRENYTNGVCAKFWINNTQNSSEILMYYGNVAALNTSGDHTHGVNTFWMFDDAENYAQAGIGQHWDVVSNASGAFSRYDNNFVWKGSKSIYQEDTGSSSTYFREYPSPSGILEGSIIRYRYYRENYDLLAAEYTYMVIHDETESATFCTVYFHGNGDIKYYDGGSSQDTGFNFDTQSWEDIEFRNWMRNDYIHVFVDGVDCGNVLRSSVAQNFTNFYMGTSSGYQAKADYDQVYVCYWVMFDAPDWSGFSSEITPPVSGGRQTQVNLSGLTELDTGFGLTWSGNNGNLPKATFCNNSGVHYETMKIEIDVNSTHWIDQIDIWAGTLRDDANGTTIYGDNLTCWVSTDNSSWEILQNNWWGYGHGVFADYPYHLSNQSWNATTSPAGCDPFMYFGDGNYITTDCTLYVRLQCNLSDGVVDGAYSNYSAWYVEISNNSKTWADEEYYTGRMLVDGLLWATIDNTINGVYVNSTSWRTLDNTINGVYVNDTIIWQTLDNTINGVYTNTSVDNICPEITINFAGNLTDSGGPYYRPPGEDTQLTGVWSDGYYTNKSKQTEGWIYLNVSIADNNMDDGTNSRVWLNWYNSSIGWINWTYSFINRSASGHWDINTSDWFATESGHDYSFNIVANDTIENSKTIWWNKTGTAGTIYRRSVQLNCTPVNISYYTPFYFGNFSYTDVDDDWPAKDRLTHDQGAGGDHDTGNISSSLPTDKVQFQWCNLYIGSWFDDEICIQSTNFTNMYFHFWWISNDGVLDNVKIVDGRDSIGNSVDKVGYQATHSSGKSFITYDNGNPDINPSYNYSLQANLIQIPENVRVNYTDNSIYEFAIIFLADAGDDPAIISNRSFQSFIIPNLPDNTTLNATNSDTDMLNDWEELFVTFTNPWIDDTDNDGIDDYWEYTHNGDPNNYTDTINVVTIDNTINGVYTNTTTWKNIDSTINGIYTNTTPNTPPIFSNETPANHSTGVSITVGAIRLLINDTEGDTFGYKWGCSDGSSNSAIGNTNGTKILMLLGGSLAPSTEYTWWINATDEHGLWTNGTYNFTTIGWNTISSSINGKYVNDTITWNTIDNTINGVYVNTTGWRNIDNTINGVYTNTTTWKNIDSTINGVYTNGTTWRTLISTINGRYINDTVIWNDIDSTINGVYVNNSYATIDNTINGRYINTTPTITAAFTFVIEGINVICTCTSTDWDSYYWEAFLNGSSIGNTGWINSINGYTHSFSFPGGGVVSVKLCVRLGNGEDCTERYITDFKPNPDKYPPSQYKNCKLCEDNGYFWYDDSCHETEKELPWNEPPDLPEAGEHLKHKIEIFGWRVDTNFLVFIGVIMLLLFIVFRKKKDKEKK